MKTFSGNSGGMDYSNMGQLPSVFQLPSRPMDRNAPYKRIATEEAWSISELSKAHEDLLYFACPRKDSSLVMGGGFASIEQAQHELCEIGEKRIARLNK